MANLRISQSRCNFVNCQRIRLFPGKNFLPLLVVNNISPFPRDSTDTGHVTLTPIATPTGGSTFTDDPQIHMALIP